jgi:histidyl-tRNA synthetase
MSMSSSPQPSERPIGRVRGTRDWLPRDYASLAALERRLLDHFTRSGYATIRTPVLELTELHERKSGAGIVAKLYEVASGSPPRLCLRPELTASVVRAYIDAAEAAELPWRVSVSGPVFRQERDPQPGLYREFWQVGAELLGGDGPEIDGELIWLADSALEQLGLTASIRIGHVGLILEMLARSGLPPAAGAALVETLSEAAAEGRSVRALESSLAELSGWLEAAAADEFDADQATAGGIDRLFRTLVPDVTGRRAGHEIIDRLRRKWDLGHRLPEVLKRIGGHVHTLADLRGPARPVLDRLARDYASLAPGSVAELRGLVAALEGRGIDAHRVELDLGFGRGIGFYSQMIFEIAVAGAEVCGGGRYDGLAHVLGSTRDARGVGFAFGLERLLGVLTPSARGGL